MVGQVISFNPDGSISGLVHKPNKGIDIVSMGKAEVSRVSEVVWSSTKQQWYVRFLKGPYSNLPMYVPQCLVDHDTVPEEGDPLPTAYFNSYDQAVNAEIAFFNKLRVEGSLKEMDNISDVA